VVLDYTTYGFVGSNVDRDTEILLVTGTLNNTVLSPFADTVTFDTNIEDGFSKLYLYNAVSSRERRGVMFSFELIVVSALFRSQFLLALFTNKC